MQSGDAAAGGGVPFESLRRRRWGRRALWLLALFVVVDLVAAAALFWFALSWSAPPNARAFAAHAWSRWWDHSPGDGLADFAASAAAPGAGGCFASQAARLPDPAARAAAERAALSTVFVAVVPDGAPLVAAVSTGSGFVAAGSAGPGGLPRVVTAAHVVQPAWPGRRIVLVSPRGVEIGEARVAALAEPRGLGGDIAVLDVRTPAGERGRRELLSAPGLGVEAWEVSSYFFGLSEPGWPAPSEGHSGGPVVDAASGRAVGIVTAGWGSRRFAARIAARIAAGDIAEMAAIDASPGGDDGSVAPPLAISDAPFRVVGGVVGTTLPSVFRDLLRTGPPDGGGAGGTARGGPVGEAAEIPDRAAPRMAVAVGYPSGRCALAPVGLSRVLPGLGSPPEPWTPPEPLAPAGAAGPR